MTKTERQDRKCEHLGCNRPVTETMPYIDEKGISYPGVYANGKICAYHWAVDEQEAKEKEERILDEKMKMVRSYYLGREETKG